MAACAVTVTKLTIIYQIYKMLIAYFVLADNLFVEVGYIDSDDPNHRGGSSLLFCIVLFKFLWHKVTYY